MSLGKTWMNRKGERISIQSMSIAHIVNTINMLLRVAKRQRVPTPSGVMAVQLRELFAELHRRLPEIEALFVDAPPHEIADILNETAAKHCAHGHTICPFRCAVMYYDDCWVSMNGPERQQWFDRMKEAADGESP